MLSQCLVPSITKKVISYLLVLGQQSLIALQIFIKLFQYILKSLKTFLIQSYLYSITKNTNKTKKTWTNFDLTTDFLIENLKLFQ